MKDHYVEGGVAVADLPTGDVIATLAAALSGELDWSLYVGAEPPEAFIERLRIEVLIRELGLR
jgi:hypothetical protein